MAIDRQKIKAYVAASKAKGGSPKDVAKDYYSGQARDTLDAAKEQIAVDNAAKQTQPSVGNMYRAAQGSSPSGGNVPTSLPSGAPNVLPAVERSVDKVYKPSKALETLAKYGMATDEDIRTVDTLRGAAIADTLAYNNMAAENRAEEFPTLVNKAVKDERHGWDTMRVSDNFKGGDNAQSVFADDLLRAKINDYSAQYADALKAYASGKDVSGAIKRLGAQQNDINDKLTSAQKADRDKFSTAVLSAYQSGNQNTFANAFRRYESGTVRLPEGYSKTDLDAETADFVKYRDGIYSKYKAGNATQGELAAVAERGNRLDAKRNAYYNNTVDGLLQAGMEYAARAEQIKPSRARANSNYDAAEARMHDAANLYDVARNDATQTDQATKDKLYADYQTADKNYRIAKRRKNYLDAAYGAAMSGSAYSKIGAEYVPMLEGYKAAKKAGYKDPDDVNSALTTAINQNMSTAKDNHLDELRDYGTAEQKRIYLWLRDTQGADKANEFAGLIKPLVDVRRAESMAREYADSGLAGKIWIGVTTQAVGGLSDFATGLGGAVKAFTGEDSYTLPTGEQIVAGAVREREKGVAAGMAMDIIRSSANMAPSIAISAITAGTGSAAVAAVGSVVSKVSFGASAGGNAYIQAINEGKDAGEAFLYGAVVGTSEVLLEKALGGIEGLGGKAVSGFMGTSAGKAVQRRLSTFLSGFGTTTKRRVALEYINAAGRMLSNMTAEGVEEFTQDMLDPIFRNMILAEDNAVFTQDNFDNAIHSFLVGFFNAGVLNAATEISRVGTVNRVIKGQGTDADVDAILASPEMRRDMERIFTKTFDMAADEGGFRFTDNAALNRLFLDMWQNGVKTAAKNGEVEQVKRKAAEASYTDNTDAASGSDIVAAINADTNSETDSAADFVHKRLMQGQAAQGTAVSGGASGTDVTGGADNVSAVKDSIQSVKGKAVNEDTSVPATPFANSRADLADKLSTIQGQTVNVNGKDYTLDSATKRSIRLVGADGKAQEIPFTGGDVAIYPQSFEVKDRNGKSWFFFFDDNQKADLGIIPKPEEHVPNVFDNDGLDDIDKDTIDERYSKARQDSEQASKDAFKADAERYRKFADDKDAVGTMLDVLIGERVMVNGRTFVLSGYDNGVVSLTDEGGNVRTVDLNGKDIDLITRSGFRAKDEAGHRRTFSFDNDAVRAAKDLVLEQAEKRTEDVKNAAETAQKAAQETAVETKAEAEAEAKTAPETIEATSTKSAVESKTKEATGKKADAEVAKSETTHAQEDTAVTQNAQGDVAVNTDQKANDTQVPAGDVQAQERKSDKSDSKSDEAVEAASEGRVESGTEAPGEVEESYVFADLPEHTVVESVDTRDNKPIYVLRLKKYVSNKEFSTINSRVKAEDGHYSRFANGFIVSKKIYDAYNVFTGQGKAAEASAKVEKRAESVQTDNASDVPYKVGDTVYLDDTAFEIKNIGKHDVELEDNTLTYPISRVESKERLMRLLSQDKRNSDVLSRGSDVADSKTNMSGAVDNGGDTVYNGDTEAVIKNGKNKTEKAGTENEQRREVLDSESGHDGGRLRSGAQGVDDQSGNQEDVRESGQTGGNVLQGSSVADTGSGLADGNVGEGVRGQSDGGSNTSEISSSDAGGRGDGRGDGRGGRVLKDKEPSESTKSDESASKKQSGSQDDKAAETSANADVAEKTSADNTSPTETTAETDADAKADTAADVDTDTETDTDADSTTAEEQDEQRSAPEEIDTEATALEKERPSNDENFVIDDAFAAEIDDTPPSAKDNIAAIQLLLKIEEEGREATPDEKRILAKYKGWGGINFNSMSYDERTAFFRLFSYEQKKAMETSSLTAYFTPTRIIDAVYTALSRMGFKGGNILESSMGIGNFFGRMPKEMRAKSHLIGVELESYTARIAQLLYPGATVINQPFQNVAMKNGAFDLVIGNVPFGNNKISYNGKKYSLHNYFILSSLDKVREGGIVAVLTSASTLDSYGIDVRKAIMDKADVVACYKLPAKLFSRNAGTDVQTDLLILRKRAVGSKPLGDSILNVVTNSDGLRINEYFEKHPENVLGVLAAGRNAYGEKITTVNAEPNFFEKLNGALENLPRGLMNGKTELHTADSIVSVETKPHYFEHDDAIYYDSGEGKAVKVEKKVDVVKDYMAVRDAYKDVLDEYEADLPEEKIKPLRDKLTRAYNAFVKKHGAITGDGKKLVGGKKSKSNVFLEEDSDYYLVSGLERYNAEKQAFEKSALFEKDTLRKKKIQRVETASDALVVSLNETGKINLARMSELTGKTQKKLLEELSDEIVLTPEGEYVLTDIYLSGNIYEKLDAVKDKPGFEKQRAMLEKVLPKPKSASEIEIKLGANYISPSYIEQFIEDVFRIRVNVRKTLGGNWEIEGARSFNYSELLTTKYGTKEMNAVLLLEKILNDGEIKIMDTYEDGGGKKMQRFNEEKTNVAKQKADDIRAAFEVWVFKDSDRRNDITDKFNRIYNAYRALDYDKIAEKLALESMSPDLRAKLYPHQKRAIARALFGKNVLFAHGVGTGKTFEMIASVMEARRMGLVNKVAMVVPKNKVSDFRKDIARSYPNAKVLIIDSSKVGRKSMLGLIASNDWDIILMSRETFTKIPVSEETQNNYIRAQIEEIQAQIDEIDANKQSANANKRARKELIKQRDSLESKLRDIDKKTGRDANGVEFEKLGSDCICVDEAHNYKSIVTPTKLNIKGLSKSGDSQRASDMLMKLDYLRSIGGKVIFGTGTPITNTVSEIYNMIRMVSPDILENVGIHSLDEFVNTFCKVDSETEIDVGNSIKDKTTQIIRRFMNPNEMIGLFRQMADVVFTEDVVTNLPKARYIQVEVEGTDEHRRIMQVVSDTIRTAKGTDKMKAYAKAMSLANAAAADLRMLAGVKSDINPFADYSVEELEHENSKINVMCDNIAKEYTESNAIRGTQIVFCDAGAGSGKVYTFNLHKDIKEKLIERGIPEKEIVIVQGQTDAQLEELYEKVNDGSVRVLIGTSAKMAEGLNVQKRVVAIHHPTVTFTPADLEQGNARGVRQGNINTEVRIYNYVQGDTFDAYKWQAQARKGDMIKRALRGEQVSELEDVGGDIDPTVAMAVASGNPLVKEKIDIDKEVTRLKTLERNHLNEIYAYQDTIAKAPEEIAQTEKYIAGLERDIGIRDKYAQKPSIVIGGKEYAKQNEANAALIKAVTKAPKDGKYHKLGTYNGFDILFKGETGGQNYSLLLKGANSYSADYTGSGNNIARFAGTLNRLDGLLQKSQSKLAALKNDLKLAKNEVGKPFEHQKELDEATQRQKDITYRYEHIGQEMPSAPKEKTPNPKERTDDIDRYRVDKREPDKWQTKRDENIAKEKAVSSGKNKEVGVQPLSTIIEKMAKKFKLPIRVGNYRGKHAGQYDKRQRGIRTRFANDIPVISHELGHHLDSEYGFSKKREIIEVIRQLDDNFKERYSKAELPSEAVAEYLREYLTNREEARNKYPHFTQVFESTLLDEDLTAITELANEINMYLSATIREQLRASFLTSEEVAKKERSERKGTLSEKLLILKDYFIDDIAALKELGDLVGLDNVKDGKNVPYSLAFLSRKAEYNAAYIITTELCDMEGKPVGKGLMERLMPVVNNMDDFNTYLLAKRGAEILQNKPDILFAPNPKLNNAKTLQEIADDIETEHPEFAEVSEDIYDFIRQVQRLYGVESGLESSEQLDYLENLYPNYVPLQRILGHSSAKLTGGAKSGFANQNSNIRRLKGSTKDFLAPTDALINFVTRVVKTARRNAVGVAIAKIANNNEGLDGIISRIAPDEIATVFDNSQKKQKLFDKIMSKEYKGIENVIDKKTGKPVNFKDLLDEFFDDKELKFMPYANDAKGVVGFRVNGETQYFQIGNKRLYKAITNIDSKELEPTLKILAKIQRWWKYGIVGSNPVYIAGNLNRDLGTAWESSDDINPLVYAAKYVQAAKKCLAEDPEYRQFLAMGGGHNTRIEWKKWHLKKELKNLVRAGEKNVAKKVLNELAEPFILAGELFAETSNPFEYFKAAAKDVGKIAGKVPQEIGEIGEFVEMIPRVKEFIERADKDPVGAMYAADDITTNFLKHGQAKWINWIFPFSNATIQGKYKAYRHFFKGDKKALAKNWSKWLFGAIALAAFQAAFNRNDKENYNNLSTYTKNNNYVFSLGDGFFIKIAKSHEFGLLSSAVDRSIEYIFGNDDAFYEFSDYLFDTLLPPGMISPTSFDNSDGKILERITHDVLGDMMFSGFFDIMANIDYKGDAIVPEYMDYYKSESDKVFDTTSKPAIAIGKMLGIAPIKIDYLMNNMAGFFWRAVQYLFPNDSSKVDLTLGFKSRLTANSQYSTDVYDIVYADAEKAQKKYDDETSSKGAASAKTLFEYENNNVRKTFVSQYRRAVRYADIPNIEKERLLTALQMTAKAWSDEPTEADKRAMELYESTGNEDVFYLTFGNNITTTLNQTVNGVPYHAELSPDEYMQFFTEACRVIDEVRSGLLNAEYLDDEATAAAVGKQIQNAISKLKVRYAVDYGEPVNDEKK